MNGFSFSSPSSAAPRATAAWQPTAELFDSLFPFHIRTDGDLRISGFGNKARLLVPQLSLGVPLFSTVEAIRPSRIHSADALRQAVDKPVLFQCPRGTRLRAQVVWLADSSTFLLLLSPWVMGGSDMESVGITWLDLPIHDASREYSHLSRMQTDAVQAAEAARLDSERQTMLLRSFMQAAEEGLLAVDAAGICWTWNSHLLDMWRLDRRELRETPAATILARIAQCASDPHACLDWLERQQFETAAGSAEFDFLTPPTDGSAATPTPRIVRIYTAPFNDSRHNYAGRRWQFRDVTVTRHMRRALARAKQEAEENAAATARFLAAMSHEVRSPLSAILELTDLLLDDSLNRSQRQILNVVRESGKHLLGLLNGVLDYARNEAGAGVLDFQPLEIAALLECVQSPFTGRTGPVALRSVIEPGVPPIIEADALRLRQVLNNLVENALKFTTAGSVTLRVRLAPAPAGSPAISILEFAVEDTGSGIDPQIADRLFRPFVQGTPRSGAVHVGSGLGLAICRQLVHLMGGTIRVESPSTGGTAVIFTHPIQ